MEKITRWMFGVVAAILVLYSGWRFWSVSLQLRDAETLLDGLRQEERGLLSGLPGEETGAGETEKPGTCLFPGQGDR